MKEQNIITKIISDAEARALEIVAGAERKADSDIDAAKALAEEARIAQLDSLKSRGEETLRRREITARLDSNKLLLAAKRQALDSVFEGALNKLCSLPAAEYTAFIDTLIKKYADDGDGIILSSRCACKNDICALPVIAEKGLRVSEAYGSFAGGLILVGKGCDKNVTFEALVQAAKDEMQADIATRLFD